MSLPGDPDAVRAASDQLAALARTLNAAHDSVAAHGRSIAAAWTGRTATLALATVEQHAGSLASVAEATSQAVAPVATYAEELRAAQADHARGEMLLVQGRAAYDGVGSGAALAADTAREQASHAMDDARTLMDDAEERALAANEAASRALGAVIAALPGARTPTPPAAGAPSLFAEIGNVAASLGNAALRHPIDGLAVLGGGALATVGVLGGLISIPLDASGVGAVVGVPLDGASVAGVLGGGAIAVGGLVDLASHATTDDHVAPLQVNADSAARSETPVADRLAQVGEPGKQKRNRQLPTDESVRELANEVMEGGTPVQRGDYPGRWVVADDGTKIGLREESDSGGPTIDVERSDGRTWKIHRKVVR